MTLDEKIEEIEKGIERLGTVAEKDHSERMYAAIDEAVREERQTLKWLEELKAWRSGLLEDIKVEIKNTNLEIAYRKGCNDALEKIKAGLEEIRDRMTDYKEECFGMNVAIEYIENCIKGE